MMAPSVFAQSYIENAHSPQNATTQQALSAVASEFIMRSRFQQDTIFFSEITETILAIAGICLLGSSQEKKFVLLQNPMFTVLSAILKI